MVAKGDPEIKKQNVVTSGEVNSMSMATGVESALPKNASAYRRKLRTMGFTWMAVALSNGTIGYLKGLRFESFGMFAEFALGPEAAGAVTEDGRRPPWEEFLKCELAVRQSWWDFVEDGKTLNEAILLSIGHSPQKTPSGLWHSGIINKFATGGGKSMGGKGRPREWAQPSDQSDYQFQPNKWARTESKGSASKGKPKGNSKGRGKSKEGGKGKGGIPRQFLGKATWCNKHEKRICFDHHLQPEGCKNYNCEMCHECCPQLGCTVSCKDGSHGIWSH